MSVLLFDLDGTVTDPGPGMVRSLSYALRALGLPEESEDNVLRYVGPPLKEAFGELLPDSDPETLDLAVKYYRERYFDIGWRENSLYDGMREALEELQTMGHQMYICTSKRRDIAEKIVSHFGLSQMFQGVCGCDLDKSKGTLVAEILEATNASLPAWMIGDREQDVTAAKENGIGSVGVLWGYGSESELRSAGADVLVRRVEELLDITFA